MAKAEEIIPFLPAPFSPSISFGGTEPLYIIRGQNLWIRSKSQNTLYAIAHKGNRVTDETVVPQAKLANFSWNVANPYILIGTGFLTDLRVGSFVLANLLTDSYFGVVEEVISDTQARMSRPVTGVEAAIDGYILPIMHRLGSKRATMERGNVVKYPRGHLLGVGRGEVRLNGESLDTVQIHRITFLGAVGGGGAGNVDVTVTAAGMTGTPVTVTVAVANNDTATIAAEKSVTALKANANVGHPSTGFFNVSSYGPTVYFIKKATGQDNALNIGYANTTASGLTNVPNSTSVARGDGFTLSELPKYAIYDPATDTYTENDYGVALPPDTPVTDPIITLSAQTGGTKNMFGAKYGVRVVAKSAPITGGTGGYSQPSANYTVTIGSGGKIRITFNRPMNVYGGQNAWDIYVTKYEDGASSALNTELGPWFLYETLTAAQLATENSVADGTVKGLIHDLEFADGELDAVDRLLTFDNFDAYPCEYVDLIASENGFTPIFFSALGRPTTSERSGRSPGPAIAVGKPDNPEAVMRDKAVSTFEGDTILGVIGSRGRHWLKCENSLQTAILTGVPQAPVTIRTFWDVGFRNPYNLRFVKDYVFGHSTAGFLRSIGVGDTSDIDFEFSTPVDDFAVDWPTSHMLTDSDPKNKAVCFFYSAYEKVGGYYVTLVLPFLPNQNMWNMPILLDGRGQSLSQTVAGTSTANQTLDVEVEAVGMAGSPKTLNVAILNGDTASVIGGKVRADLAADVDVAAFFDVAGTGANYTITVKQRASRDATMALTHKSAVGIPISAAAVESWVQIQDMIVSGVATVGQSMYFIGGGRTSQQTVDFRTYEFFAEDNIPMNCYAAWAFTDLANEQMQSAVRGIASVVGRVTNARCEIHGVEATGLFDLEELEDGHNDPLKTMEVGSNAGIGRLETLRQNLDQLSKFTCRFSFESINGEGRLDELNILVNQIVGSRK